MYFYWSSNLTTFQSSSKSCQFHNELFGMCITNRKRVSDFVCGFFLPEKQ